jgi:hypothetical protein
MYIAYTSNYWGVGETVVEAKNAMRKAGGSFKDGRIVRKFPEGATNCRMDQMGRILWSGPTGDMEIVEDTRKKSDK